MHNLFTPVEVIKSNNSSYPPEALLRFQQQLYTMTQPRVLSLADERKRLISWFRGLPLLERRHVATFHSPQFACMLGRLFEKWQQTAQPFKYRFSMKNDKYYAVSERSYHNYRNKEKQLLEQVVLVSKSQLYEAITLSEGLLKEPQWLFDLLEELQGGVSESLGDFDPKEIQSGQVSFQIESQSEPKLLGVWVGTLIMKQIALCFTLETQKINNVCLHHHNQEREYSSLWQDLTIQQKQKLIKSAFSKSSKDILTDYAKSVDVLFECLPTVYIQEKNNDGIQYWKQCQPRQLMNQLTYSPLLRSFSLFNMYRIEIILQIQSMLTQNNKAARNKKNKARKKKKKEENAINKEHQLTHSDELPNKTSVSLQTKTTVESKSIPKVTHIKVAPQPKIKTISAQTIQLDKIVEESKIESSVTDIKIQPEYTEIKPPQREEKNLNMKLEALYKKIKEQSRDRCRKLVLNRLVHILGKIGLVCKPYGSFATQVSLPDSDLDISVDSSVLSFFSFQYLTHRNQVILALQYIANTLKMYPWLKDFKLLDRAKVPLLTFNADASQYFELGPEEKTKFRVNSKKIDPEKAVVQVDLTVQPFANTPELPHCGMQSTESLKAWLSAFPQLQKAIILLKILLRKANLHKTFEGGLGSYTLSLLLIAYFRQVQEQPTCIETVLKDFASFLKQFLNQRWVIDPQGQTPVVKQAQVNGPFLRHPYDGHNLLQKCMRFPAAVEAIQGWVSLSEQL